MEQWRLIAGGAAGVVLLIFFLWTVSASFGLASVWKKVPKNSKENRRMGRAHTLNVIGLGGIAEAKIMMQEGVQQWTVIGVAVVILVIGVSLVISAENRLKRSA
ncbi:hypothetical protein GCM10010174_25180 [Kutzneria viridogrisea]|uniref:Uncharacterized protein n=2 Tax=Kutzneria TaxID=43356 RepID=W5W560_9PSEU|nr:hypothetical protein [Kutzneria albida]AHH95905.1 hypothetical protein KALB_2537 [Kutzneria albida DSM 43870]MBA8928895.1 hypothetical protein [Kutzneria viridogrisea]